ncbi:hypothetical protein SZ54_4808 [Rhizobium sp. UR51a]|nr:hypothetical protein SZ54_4808 [Rhizobium sp. UR51a]
MAKAMPMLADLEEKQVERIVMGLFIDRPCQSRAILLPSIRKVTWLRSRSTRGTF